MFSIRTSRGVFLWTLPLFFLCSLAMVNAQETQSLYELEARSGGTDAAQQEGTTSCFDYYSFGSVQANLTTSVSSVVSGSVITFRGTLVNSNPYPVVDGALYVKIFKKRGSAVDGNGPDVVDQFIVKGDIVIPAKGSVPVSFTWSVPSNAQSGEYSLATFFTTSRKFNLLGLSFTDDVVGNVVPFTVSGEQNVRVAFDKTKATVDGKPFYFAAYPPRVSAAAPIPVGIVIENTDDVPQTARLQWVIYQWDAQLRENAVQEKTETVTIPARGTLPVSVTVTDNIYPVYLAVGTLEWKGTKSIVDIRFVRQERDRVRINFPGVMAYPLRAGEENTLFSCLHNSGDAALVTGARLDISLSDADGNLIHTYSYDGNVTGAMMGLADQFTPTKDYDRFILDASLYQDGQFVDEARLVYDCNEIAPGTCRVTEASFADYLFNRILVGNSLYWLIAGIAVLIMSAYVFKQKTV